MKKVLSKITHHRDHHQHHRRSASADHDGSSLDRDLDHHQHQDEELRASLYEDTEPRAPPRVGHRPIKGNVTSEPSSPSHPPTLPAGTALTADREQRTTITPVTQGDDDLAGQRRHDGDHPLPPTERGMPTNFSRLTIGPARTRASMTERKLPPTPATATSASAIQPQDLASPEFSYLSKVYGRGSRAAGDRNDPSALPLEPVESTTRPPALSGNDASQSPRSGRYPDAPSLQMHAAAPAASPVPEHHSPGGIARGQSIPRKRVGSGQHASHHPGGHDPADRRSAPGYALSEDGSSGISSAAETQRPSVEHPTMASPPPPLMGRPSSAGVVDLGTKVDTEVITTLEPAVVQETVIKDVRHIRQERIYQEIHTYDIYHRILPVIDVQVLPPRHYVPDGHGGLREVSADEVPGRLGHWGIVETVTKLRPGDTSIPLGPAEPQIISRRSYIAEDGVPCTETTWKHPPTLATGARDAGETWPLLICPEAFAEKHGALRIAAPADVPVSSTLAGQAATARAKKALLTGLPPGMVPQPSASTRESWDQSHSTSSASAAGAAPTNLPSGGSARSEDTSTVAPAYMPPSGPGTSDQSSSGQEPRVKRRDLHGSRSPLPGAFPS